MYQRKVDAGYAKRRKECVDWRFERYPFVSKEVRQFVSLRAWRDEIHWTVRFDHTRKRKNFKHSRVAHVCWKTILSTAKYLLYTSYNLMPKLPYFRNGANIINQLESAWINQLNGSFAAKKEPTFRGGQAKLLQLTSCSDWWQLRARARLV